MFTCKVNLGYDPELAYPATVTTTEIELVIKQTGSDPLVLRPEQVVSFEVKGWIPFFSQVVVVHYIASNKLEKIVMKPALTTCRKVIEGIRSAGFIPKAQNRAFED